MAYLPDNISFARLTSCLYYCADAPFVSSKMPSTLPDYSCTTSKSKHAYRSEALLFFTTEKCLEPPSGKHSFLRVNDLVLHTGHYNTLLETGIKTTSFLSPEDALKVYFNILLIIQRGRELKNTGQYSDQSQALNDNSSEPRIGR